MQIITEQQIAEILDPEIAFFAVQDVFKSMETEAWNFPVVRESLGFQDALYGFKSGFDPVSGALGLKAGGTGLTMLTKDLPIISHPFFCLTQKRASARPYWQAIPSLHCEPLPPLRFRLIA